VSITAATHYVVSYHTNSGHYADDTAYFATTGFDNPPLHALKDGGDGANGVYVYSADSAFPTNAYQSSNYWVDVIFTPSGTTPDVTPPGITSRSPAAGASSVSVTTAVTATFSEAVVASSVSFALKSAGGVAIPASVLYDNSTFTATLKPATKLSTFTIYTATVSGGKDLAGNTMSPVSWSFTTGGTTQPSCPCMLWPSTAIPTVAADTDSRSIEVGVKFRSDVSGRISAIRFYKSPSNTGLHVVSLWTTSGTLLAQATSSNETASGWQQVNFATPLAITAGTTYIASYHATEGHYADDVGFFATSGVDNGPLHALRDGTDGPNGVYSYSLTSVMPTTAFRASNYWVDVLFIQ
jgi:hypothetical protein